LTFRQPLLPSSERLSTRWLFQHSLHLCYKRNSYVHTCCKTCWLVSVCTVHSWQRLGSSVHLQLRLRASVRVLGHRALTSLLYSTCSGALGPPTVVSSLKQVVWLWLDGVTVKTLDLLSQGRRFDFRLGRYQVVFLFGWVTVLWTAKPFLYITITKVNSAFHPSAAAKSSTGLCRWG